MPKYLRYIACHFTDGDGRGDQDLMAANREAPEIGHLCWMYEHYATPLRSDGVAKVNVFFTAADLNRLPDEVQDIASVYQPFDAGHFRSLPPAGRQQYFVDRLHGAVFALATHFGWDAQPLVAAWQRIIAENFQFAFFWKKPLSSPDRRWKVQAFIQAFPYPGNLYLIFFDGQMQEQRRVLLNENAFGPGAVEAALGRIQWVDSDTVQIWHWLGPWRDCFRDYWLCRTDGHLEFHYPRAEQGDPHGEFDLGRMYDDGGGILQNRERGLALIQSAASKGFKHAQRFPAYFGRGPPIKVQLQQTARGTYA